jgi:hypothetical protein
MDYEVFHRIKKKDGGALYAHCRSQMQIRPISSVRFFYQTTPWEEELMLSRDRDKVHGALRYLLNLVQVRIHSLEGNFSAKPGQGIDPANRARL